ncbi:DNA replication protein DnaD [Alteribacillus persepolensis]|uniref:DNA replication protein DnaD n=1 Tax=Alteribacillus persepolensis TaxID=568899 RepID=A0A1G7ZCJ6_9BACI|nr:DnaD domain-containing protein [Alteribacillus persepolensis]SDH06462.1 DNA replication protein DnaD [Alteribacillus persepolensis]
MKRSQVVALMQYGHSSISKLLLDYYAQIGLTETEMMLLLHINRFIEDSHPFPTPMELSERMSISDRECSELLRTLIKKDCLRMEENQDENNVLYETYSLSSLYERILQEFFQETKGNQQAVDDDGRLFEVFEKEFSRPLSPMEYETISVWLDQDRYTPALIKAALREAVLSGKLNLRYMDRILHEWHKNGIKTPQAAKEHGEKFRQQQTGNRKTGKPKGTLPQYPNINWLDES